MPEFWAGLNFSGNNKPKSGVTYRTENFRSASSSIQKLREVSRAGKEETDWIVAQEAGKPKIVYGEKEPWTAAPFMLSQPEEESGEVETQSTEGLPGNPAPAYTAHNWSNEVSLMEGEE